jgi:crotonobetainyl-CoA hydratase
MADAVRVTRDGAVCEIVLDRPKANAIDVATSRALYAAFRGFQDDPTLTVAILTGGGERFFSAGWDLKAAAEREAVDADHGPGGFAGLTEFFDLDKPVIAAVNGLALGGGMELALACDMIVAAGTAEFGMPEAMLGVIADTGGVQRLPKRLPRAIAMDLLLTGRRFTAAEAERWGLVNRLVPAASLMDEARALARTVAGAAPLAVRAVKATVTATEGLSDRESFALLKSGTVAVHRQLQDSEDAKEGPLAFAEKRKPVWKGR